MLTGYWDSEGAVHTEFSEKGATINSARYVQTLQNRQNRIRRVRRQKTNVSLLHDNARTHTSNATCEAIENLNFTVIPHPPYSPNLAPSDFHLFSKLKDHLKGQQIGSIEEVKAAVLQWCRSQSADFYHDGIQKRVYRG